MKLHESSDFKDAILATAQDLGLPDVFVEKDYWVTLVLYRIFRHPSSNKIVFKGGTSLSKAYGVIERFSEDVDLALTDISNLNGNQIKKLIDQTSKTLMGVPFRDIDEDKRNSKGSRFRRTSHRYPRLDLAGEFRAASPDLLLEINSFTDPHPIVRKQVQSYIGSFFSKNAKESLTAYDLSPFEIQVLSLERTYAEKFLGLVRHSYLGAQSLREKIHHLYDLARLESCAEIQALKSDPLKLRKILEAVKRTDQTNPEFAGKWLDLAPHVAPLFTDEAIKNAMKEAYQGSGLQSLIWDRSKTPSFSQAWDFLVATAVATSRDDLLSTGIKWDAES